MAKALESARAVIAANQRDLDIVVQVSMGKCPSSTLADRLSAPVVPAEGLVNCQRHSVEPRFIVCYFSLRCTCLIFLAPAALASLLEDLCTMKLVSVALLHLPSTYVTMRELGSVFLSESNTVLSRHPFTR